MLCACDDPPAQNVFKCICVMRYHHTPTTMAKSKMINSIKCWQGLGATGVLLRGWWQSTAIILEYWQCLTKLNVYLLYDQPVAF